MPQLDSDGSWHTIFPWNDFPGQCSSSGPQPLPVVGSLSVWFLPWQPQQTTPNYTGDAIKAKADGIVTLQAVIRKNGRVDSFKVLSGLGYGLEEKAIQEISTQWRFRPGTLHGRPVDVMVTIEVQFNLR